MIVHFAGSEAYACWDEGKHESAEAEGFTDCTQKVCSSRAAYTLFYRSQRLVGLSFVFQCGMRSYRMYRLKSFICNSCNIHLQSPMPVPSRFPHMPSNYLDASICCIFKRDSSTARQLSVPSGLHLCIDHA